ncbi:MAG: transglycosylase SLT domain-containing protein [Blastocatellia bacterium]
MNHIIRKLATSKFYNRGIALGLLLFAPLMAQAQAQAVSVDEGIRQRARSYESLFISAARQHGIDARLLWVIAYLESRFRPQANSPKGARGLMQLMPATAARWGVRNPYEPAQAITGAARYVQYLGQRFAGRVDLTLAAYNAGETAVAAYRAGRTVRVGHKLINPFGLRTDGVPPYRETRAYVYNGTALLRRLSVSNPATTIVYTPVPRTVQSSNSDALIISTTMRKSISYAEEAAPSIQPASTTSMSRSISYQGR